MPKVLEVATFAWCAAKALNLKEDDVPLDKLEEGLCFPNMETEGSTVLSLFMSRLVVHQELEEENEEERQASLEGAGNEETEATKESNKKTSTTTTTATKKRKRRKKGSDVNGHGGDDSDSDYDPGTSVKTEIEKGSIFVKRINESRSRVGLPYS